MEFSGDQLERLVHVIVDTYTPDKFRRLLRYNFNKDLSNISIESSFPATVFALISSAEREGWLSDLVAVIISENRGNIELRSLVPSPPNRSVDFAVVAGDVFTFHADVLALKYAQSFYGVDRRVAEALSQTGVSKDLFKPRVGDYKLIESRRALRTPRVLFVGVPDLIDFAYRELREFSSSIIRILARDDSVGHLAMTLHGANYGLDEIEALFSLIAGSVEVLASPQPLYLHRISIVEQDPNRVRRLGRALRHNLEQSGYTDFDVLSEGEAEWSVRLRLSSIGSAKTREFPGTTAESKRRVFVAMPFKEEFEDLFEYGIQQPTRDLQFLCERADNEIFTGDILDRVKKDIDDSVVVIAVLDGSNPNVYLEVGYAWGRGRPTILIANEAEKLPFNVQGQRYLKYRRIKEVEQGLKDHLKAFAEM